MDNADFERRLALLEAERAIMRTLARYASSLDYGDHAACADCFVETGVAEVHVQDAEPIKLVGRPMILANFSKHTYAPHRWHKHITTQPTIDIDLGAGAAASTSYMLRVDRVKRDGDLPKIWSFGRYIDDLCRSEDGRWRFTRRVVEIEALQPMKFNKIDVT